MVQHVLRAQHWQIFLFSTALPIVLQMIMMATMFFNMIKNPDPTFLMPAFFNWSIVLMVVYLVGYLIWYWSTGVGLQRYIPEALRLNVRLFKVFLIAPIIYIVVIMAFFSSIMLNFSLNDASPSVPPFAFFLLIPFHLFAMFCKFYCLYFVARTVKTAELQRKLEFGDYIGEFFLIWFFAVGIWFVQPKINKVVNEQHLDA